MTTQTPNAALPPSPWNSRGGGLFQGIFSGPTTTVRVFPPFAPGYSLAPQPNAPAAYRQDRERTNMSSSCIRMRNDDVIDLYQRVKVGTKVVVI